VAVGHDGDVEVDNGRFGDFLDLVEGLASIEAGGSNSTILSSS
jgi:hypothetical protein